MKRVMLVAGAGGMLGKDLVEALGDDYQVVPMEHAAFDITDLAAIKKVLRKVKPDVLVNAAAYTAVDGCEQDPDKAFTVNALGARNLAVGAERFGCELVQVSTDYVFDGSSQTPYSEWDRTSPVGVYGRSKHAGEELVRSLCRRHYVVRVGILFGPHRKNFVEAVIERAEKGEDIRVPAGRVGSPVYTFDLALAIGKLAGTERFGTIHFNHGEAVSRAELARRVLAARKLGGVKIHEVDPKELGEVAPRPGTVAMAIDTWRREGFPAPRGLDAVLADYLARKSGDANVTQGKDRGWISKGGPKPTITKRAEPRVWVPLREGGLDTKIEEEGGKPRRRFEADAEGGGAPERAPRRFPREGDRPPPRRFGRDGGDRGPPRRFDRDGGDRGPPRRFDRDGGDRGPPRRFDRDGGDRGPPRRFDRDGGDRGPPRRFDRDGGDRGPPRRFDRDGGGRGPPRRFDRDGGGAPPPRRTFRDSGFTAGPPRPRRPPREKTQTPATPPLPPSGDEGGDEGGED